MYSLQLTHPFGLLFSGGTKTGKTTFVKQRLLGNVQVMIDPPPENIKYFYSEYQDTFAEIKSLVPNIEFIEGVPDVIFDSINPKTRNLYIFDDMMGERDSMIAKLFTKKSHHDLHSVIYKSLSVIYIVQNLFHQSKDHRTISLNASYIVLTKNVRDASQVIHLAKQIYPNNVKYFQHAYQMATAEPFSYLFIDLTPTCPDETRLRSGIFPNDKHYVYVPRTQNNLFHRNKFHLIMSARLRRNSDFLKVLRKCTPAQRKAILEVAHDDLLEALTECCMNVYLKTIKVNPSVLKRLTQLKEDLRFVADNRNPLNQRREVLLQKGEGFLSLILTPIVEQLASLLTQ